MKKYIPFVFLIVLALGCETESKLTFETLHVQNEPCDNCPEVKIEIPKVLGESRIAKTINTALTEELIYVLKWEENDEISNLNEAIGSFTNSYQALQKKFDDEKTIPWEVEILGEVVYETENIISLSLNVYTFTGGAHGYGANILLNFDKTLAIELENYEVFSDLEGFRADTEKNFRTEKEIPLNGNINATGFMFTGDTFHLPENIGFNAEGIQLIYNQYEIASYADGPIELVISFKDANPFLKEEYQVKED